MNNAEFPKVIYWLVEADPEKRTGVLKMKNAEPANAPYRTINVSLSGLLASRIKRNDFSGLVRPQTYVGTKFISELHSKEFNENPFKLTHFVPENGSDIPEHYELGLVNERYTPKETLEDAMGNQISVIRRFRRTSANNFLRYVKVGVSKMMAELSENVVIVRP